MNKKAIEILLAGILGIGLFNKPVEEPAVEAEREIIELPWDFGIDEEEALTQYNIDLLARVCMSEAGNEPYIGKVAVVMTVLNRCDAYGMTTEQVVYQPDQYSTADNGKPTEECYSAVAFAIENRNIFPADMMYFRKNHYHTFGVPYTPIGEHYFSTKGD